MSSKVRRVRTPEGAKFYGAPIGTPIVADKAGKFFAKTAKLPQAPLLKDWKPGDPTDRIKAQITDVVRGVLDEAGLPEGTLTVSVKPASTLSKLTVAVRYSRPDDYKKASVALHRQIYPSERKVHNWQFSVAKDLQGHGIGAKMTAALEDLWRSEGIETVTVGANADVGGYAWARLGFEFKDPAQAAEFVSDAQKQITKYAPIWAKKVSPEYVEDVKAQVQALQERLDAGDTILPAEIAMLGYREGPGGKTWGSLDDPPFYWLGKRVMLGTSWAGEKDISQPVVMQQATRRTRKKATGPNVPKGGEWIFEDGSAVEFVAPHEELVAGGLRSWIGSPADMHIHMADEIAGAPQPSSGSGKIMRAQAKALLEELASHGQPTPRLYRGGNNTSLDQIPQSWSQNRRTANYWAKLSGGTVSTLQPGEAVGIRMADYIDAQLDEGEQQWLVVAPQVLAQRTKRNAQTAPDDAFEGFSPEEQAGLQELAKVRPVELTPQQRDLRRRWRDLGLDEWDIPVRSHGRWTAQPDGSRVNEFGDTLRIDADLSPQEQYQIQQSFDRALATLPKVYFDAESDQPTSVGLYVPKPGEDPMFDDNFSDAYVMRGTPLITLSPAQAKSSGRGMRLDRTVLHEMGHVVDGRLGHTNGMDVLGNPMGEAQGDGGLFISMYPQFANRYAGSDPHEGYAEMYREFFSAWIDPYSGPTQASKKYARKYKWAGRPRKKGQKVLAQRTKRNAPPKGSGAEILQPEPPKARKPLALSREDEVKSKIAGVQKVKDTLADIDVSLRAGVRERIQQAVDTYFEYARQIGINNPMLSPADIFARPDVQALWGQEAGSLASWLDSRISEGYNKGVDLASPSGPVNDSYLQALRADAAQYLQTLGGQVQAGVWNAYNSTPWVSSYQQGGTSTNVPHDTAVLRWQRAQANQRAAVTDISKRAHAGIGSATQRGYTDGQLADVTDPTMLKMWVANFAQDPERGPCLTCIALHGTTIPVTESFDASITFAAKTLGVYGDLLGPPRHPHCFPADTLVSAPDVELGYVRYYEGPMVRVTTESGQILSATPNHPVLTRSRGWQPIGSLTPRDDLCRYLGDDVDGGSDVQDVPARIADVVMSLAERGHTATEGSAGDFHGDGANGEVHVVGADGTLLGEGDVGIAQCGHEVRLVTGDVGQALLVDQSPTPFLSVAHGGAATSVVGSRRDTTSLLERQAGHASRRPLATVADLDPVVGEPTVDDVPGNLVAQAELLLGNPSKVVFDRIVEVVWDRDWAGHVYNLQTARGWYAANTYVSANCKCKLVFFAAHEEHEPVSKKMSEYATTKVAEQMVAKGFTASEVRAMPQPLFDSLWRFLRSGGWWKRLWRRLRRSG